MMAAKDKSGLYDIDLDAHAVNLVSSPPVPYDYLREALLINNGSDGFIVVAALHEGAWYKYSSESGEWTALSKWKPCDSIFTNHNYLVFSPFTRSFYYHIHGNNRWEAVRI